MMIAMGVPPTCSAAVVIDRLHELLEAGHNPVFVGIDGRSGAGKSTLAAALASDLIESGDVDVAVTVIEGDLFYSGGSADTWDGRTAADKADLVIDWRRQRRVLEQLRGDGIAEWHPFAWDADDWDADVVPLAEIPVVTRIAPVVVLEGAYSCRPELHDLLDLLVFLDVSPELRSARLREREGDAYRADWEARWSMAEDHYFGSVMPPERFDLVFSVR